MIDQGLPAPNLSRGELNARWFWVEAVALTFVCGAATYLLLGRPPLIGIDDANITQTYASHLASGLGYVYCVGGERVEGSTSLLWTFINAIAFAASSTPERLIAGLCFLLSVVSVAGALRLADGLARAASAPRALTNAMVVVALLASPAYFAWSLWTLMDVTLWSAALIWFVVALGESIAPFEASSNRGPVLSVLSAALPIIRPEGIAIVLGLILAAYLIAGTGAEAHKVRCRLRRSAGLATLLFAGVTSARVLYFGYPVPNTFYAKISTAFVTQAIHGLHYLGGFVIKTPNATTYIVSWLFGAIWVMQTQVSPSSTIVLRRGAIGATAMLLLFVIYTLLGGDHFTLHRFLQPVSLILPSGFAVIGAYGIDRVKNHHWPVRWISAATVATVLLVTGGAYGDFSQSASSLRREIDYAQDGREIAAILSGIEPRASVGVIAAGGIARAYDGRIFDLMGLNWVAMAHADPAKTSGIRGHGGFNSEVFWRVRPQVIAFVGNRCGTGAFHLDEFESRALKGLGSTERFKKDYARVSLGCFLGFARRDWLHDAGASQELHRFETD
jgi:arabinofuranosyltransferase